jgi:DNA methylase
MIAPLLPGFAAPSDGDSIVEELRGFTWHGRSTQETSLDLTPDGRRQVPVLTNEFWTSRQRAAHSLHEVSYRACFKPQLPRFFIERLTSPGARVYDPFMGRGTTLLEAALLGRAPAGCDANPLAQALIAPRLQPPSLREVEDRLRGLRLDRPSPIRVDLEVFYHPDTLREISGLRQYLLERERRQALDRVDRWIRMVALNRLTGHSPGFFSVYTLPPNQAVSLEAQAKINRDRQQAPSARDVKALILTKSRRLLKDVDAGTAALLARVAPDALLMTGLSAATPALAAASIDLVVTSPPFLDVVDYASDNWLRCWFCDIEPAAVRITMAKRLAEWEAAMRDVFTELHRVLKPGGFVAFEVGEVRGGAVRLEEAVVPAAAAAGLEPVLVLINAQQFTKTANCWGVKNNTKGTNTNRIVLLRKGSAVRIGQA